MFFFFYNYFVDEEEKLILGEFADIFEKKLTKALLGLDKRLTFAVILGNLKKNNPEKTEEILKNLNLNKKTEQKLISKNLETLKQLRMDIGVHPSQKKIESLLQDGSLKSLAQKHYVWYAVQELLVFYELL